MNKELLLQEIREELKSNVDEKYQKDNQKYHIEKIKSYGVRTPYVRKIAKRYFKQVKLLDKNEIFGLCEDLFKTDYNEETTIAIQWISEIKDRWEEKDFKKLEHLLSYINNWGKCDDFCLSVISHFIVKFPKFRTNIKEWSKSSNMWKRRASAVSFIRGGSWTIYDKYLDDVFDIANQLLHDREDLIQKGYGWMLKITAETFQKEVFDFVIKHKKTMPRTALRYAIEKMPQNMRKEAMKKN